MLRPDLPADVRVRRLRRRRRVGGPMRVTTLTASVVAWVGAALASLCCLLPLTVIVLGLGSGAFMATTMQYRWLLEKAHHVVVAAAVLVGEPERLIDVLEGLGLEAEEALREVPGALDDDARERHGMALEELVGAQDREIGRA